MDSFSSNSPADIKKTLQENYPNLPDSLKKFVIYATPVEIGFLVNKKTSISVMFSEGFKGFLVVNRENNIERRIAFVRTFFGRETNIPAIDFVEVVFENNMPAKRSFLNVLFVDQPDETFFEPMNKALSDKNLTLFLDIILERGKKSSGSELVSLTDTDKEFATYIFNKVIDVLKSELENNKEFKDAINSYITENKENFPLMAEMFSLFINTI